MNILLIIVCIFFLACMFNGYRKGLIKTIFSFGATLLALFITTQCYSYVGKGINEYTQIGQTIQTQIESSLSINSKEDEEIKGDQTDVINNLKLPQSIKESLINNNNKEIYGALNVDNFYQYISMYLANTIVNGLAFLITFIVVGILLRTIMLLLDIITELPILKGINKIGGLLLGMLEGIIGIWIFFVIVTVLGSTDFGKSMYAYMDESLVLSFLYNNNILLEFITNMSKLLF